MRDQLTQYVNLLFAGAHDADEIRAEILQNTLDRYDDLVEQGKSPEAAYRLAISGIGDISEILGGENSATVSTAQNPAKRSARDNEDDRDAKKYRAVAVSMYILCPIPLFILSELGVPTLGLCLTIGLVATATYLIVVYGKKEQDDTGETVCVNPQVETEKSAQLSRKSNLSKIIWAIGLALYFILSFATDAWSNTWLIFPITGCVNGLMKAIIDLKEATKHEN